MERIRLGEAATVTVVGAFAVVTAVAVGALAALGKAPPEAFFAGGLGLVALGTAVAVVAEAA